MKNLSSVEIKIRPNYIDLAKVLMIYIVVLGHYGYALNLQFSPNHLWRVMHYITLFHMPFFFFVSGLLFKDADVRTTLNKGVIQLIKPYLLLSIINLLIMSIVNILNGDFSLKESAHIVAAILTGSDCKWGRWWYADSLWFCYALFIIKLLSSIVGNSKSSYFKQGGVLLLMSAGVFVMFCGDILPCRFDSSLVGFIFFTFGCVFKDRTFNLLGNVYSCVGVIILAIIILSVVSNFNLVIDNRNGACSIDAMRFGPYPPLFVLSGLSGSLLMMGLCRLFSFFICRRVLRLSNGTIIILGFHWLIYKLVISPFSPNSSLLSAIIISFIIVLLCYPLIFIAEQKFPILLGNRK